MARGGGWLKSPNLLLEATISTSERAVYLNSFILILLIFIQWANQKNIWTCSSIMNSLGYLILYKLSVEQDY